MNITNIIATELGIKDWQVDAVISLINDGCTIPFIARYRKEKTGSLDDEILRKLNERLDYLNNLSDRKDTILKSIEEQGKLTDRLKEQIDECQTLAVLEDLYRPYKQKRRTRATIAKEAGLEPLAQFISIQLTNQPVRCEAKKYINPDKKINTVDDAINGALDILAEEVSDNAMYRAHIKEVITKEGIIASAVKDADKDEKGIYEMYYEYEESIKKIPGHRVLALNRGEKEKILTVKVNSPDEKITGWIFNMYKFKDNPYTDPLIKTMVEDAYNRLLKPSIDNEIRNMLTASAEDSAIEVFGKNLTQLLMTPPIQGKTVLGWDPAFRTGCKIAVVDATGKVLDTTVVYPTEPTTPEKIEKAKKVIAGLIKKYNVDLISLGNGTASRESERFIVELLKQIPEKVEYVIVNEAGASVYSASKLATKEFPDLNVGERSSTSMARRLQDPLAELVKIDPKSIGVGQYQHDMDQKKLESSLGNVVEACVNKVGVDLNTASAPLLSYVSGINASIADNIVKYREENGEYKSRKELLKVSKLGPKAYEQCAGFLRIREAANALDNTGVHPESYDLTYELLKLADISKKDISKLTDIQNGTALKKLKTLVSEKNIEKTADELNAGKETLIDIVKELEKPGRDPRDEMPKPILKSDVLELEDLKEGMVLKGTVRNVIDFGAFVDIGVHQDGLVHISELSDSYVKHPIDIVSVGDIVDVKVLSVDLKKKRIQLTMKNVK